MMMPCTLSIKRAKETLSNEKDKFESHKLLLIIHRAITAVGWRLSRGIIFLQLIPEKHFLKHRKICVQMGSFFLELCSK